MRTPLLATLTLLTLMMQAPLLRAAEAPFPTLSIKFPYLQERLHSSHQAVRYVLAISLNGRDPETRQALEILLSDPDPATAGQAFRNYTNSFVLIDKKLCRIEFFGPTRFRIGRLPEANRARTLVNYCLGIKQDFNPEGGDDGHDIRPLNPSQTDNASQVDSLLIIGIFGTPEDAKALYPFLKSSNPYVALNAAKSLFRLGDTKPAAETLKRLAASNPTPENLFYIIESLYALHEINDPDYTTLLSKALANFAGIKDIHAGALNDLLLLARETDSTALK